MFFWLKNSGLKLIHLILWAAETWRFHYGYIYIGYNWFAWAVHCEKIGQNTSKDMIKLFFFMTMLGLGQNWFASKDESFFLDGIRKLPENWEKVVGNDGQYFNWSVHSFSFEINTFLNTKKRTELICTPNKCNIRRFLWYFMFHIKTSIFKKSETREIHDRFIYI